MYDFTDEGDAAGIEAQGFPHDNAQMELLLECHRASRLLQRLQMLNSRKPPRPNMPMPRPPVPPFGVGLDGPAGPFARQALGSMQGQGRLLHHLMQADGVLIKDIVMTFDIRPSSASELVAKLEKQGLVRVESDTEDKRARKVFLTDEGKALSVQIQTSVDGHASDLLDPLDEEEQAQLLALLKKLNTGLADKSRDFSKGPGLGHGHSVSERHGHPGSGPRRRPGGDAEERGQRGFRVLFRGPRL
jgi:DNA-binding MarR family transcriptional regulator